MKTTYQIKHLLTKKIVLDNHTLKPITFNKIGEAKLFLEVKTKIMGANFYEIVEVNAGDVK